MSKHKNFVPIPPLTAAQAKRGDEVIIALSRLWPQCFFRYGKRRQPLMIGIDKMLIEQMQPAIKAGRISELDIKWALQRYTRSTTYLQAIAAGKPRIDLAGREAGQVTEPQRLAAEKIVQQRLVRAEARKAETLAVENPPRPEMALTTGAAL